VVPLTGLEPVTPSLRISGPKLRRVAPAQLHVSF
jgi:hypothetical protein